MLWGSTKALNVAKLATLHAFLLTSFSLSDCSSTRDACQRAHTLSGPRPIRGGVRPSLSLIGLDHDISLTGVSFVEPHRVSESRILFFSFLEWLDAPVRPGIFVSRTREKLGCTCDQIGRTLEPWWYFKMWSFLIIRQCNRWKLSHKHIFKEAHKPSSDDNIIKTSRSHYQTFVKLLLEKAHCLLSTV